MPKIRAENLTDAEIRQACNMLKQAKKPISSNNVFTILKRGSLSTIVKVINQYKEEEFKAESVLSTHDIKTDELQNLAIELVTKIQLAAIDAFNEKLKRKLSKAEHDLELHGHELYNFSTQIDSLKNTVKELKQANSELQEQVKNKEEKRLKLKTEFYIMQKECEVKDKLIESLINTHGEALEKAR